MTSRSRVGHQREEYADAQVEAVHDDVHHDAEQDDHGPDQCEVDAHLMLPNARFAAAGRRRWRRRTGGATAGAVRRVRRTMGRGRGGRGTHADQAQHVGHAGAEHQQVYRHESASVSVSSPNPCGVAASAVRITPYTTQGWRPTSVTYQPASMAISPEGPIHSAKRCSARIRTAGRASASTAPRSPARSSGPNPTMTRKDQNTTGTLGRSAAGRTSGRELPVPAVGEDQAAQARDVERVRVSSLSMSGRPNRVSGRRRPARFPNGLPWRRPWRAGA